MEPMMMLSHYSTDHVGITGEQVVNITLTPDELRLAWNADEGRRQQQQGALTTS